MMLDFALLPPSIEDSDRGDQDIKSLLALSLRSKVVDVHEPLRFHAIPLRLANPMPELDVLVDIVPPCGALPEVSDLLALSILLTPFPVGRESRLIDVL